MKHNAMMLTCSMMVLTACKAGTPPPAISYDREEFKPAKIEEEPARPVEIVEVPKPLPLPGQLSGQPPADKLSPEQRVETANTAALLEPSKHGYVNAVQVYPYSEGALYRLYGAPGQVTNIALQPGEQLRAVSAGDTVRWVIGDTTSGSGDNQQGHILIKSHDRHRLADLPSANAQHGRNCDGGDFLELPAGSSGDVAPKQCRGSCRTTG